MHKKEKYKYFLFLFLFLLPLVAENESVDFFHTYTPNIIIQIYMIISNIKKKEKNLGLTGI